MSPILARKSPLITQASLPTSCVWRHTIWLGTVTERRNRKDLETGSKCLFCSTILWKSRRFWVSRNFVRCASKSGFWIRFRRLINRLFRYKWFWVCNKRSKHVARPTFQFQSRKQQCTFWRSKFVRWSERQHFRRNLFQIVCTYCSSKGNLRGERRSILFSQIHSSHLWPRPVYLRINLASRVLFDGRW